MRLVSHVELHPVLNYSSGISIPAQPAVVQWAHGQGQIHDVCFVFIDPEARVNDESVLIATQ